MTAFKLEIMDNGASSEVKREHFSLDQQGVSNWLTKKNIIGKQETLLIYRDIKPWFQSGAETFCSIFEIITNKQIKRIVIKALVTLSPQKSLQDWERRRKVLFENEVPVSNWYFFGDATIIEDYYPNTFQNVEFEKIILIGKSLDKLGFSTLSFTDDIRADTKFNPFYIDFGFDLGEPSLNKKTTALEYLFQLFPTRMDEIKFIYSRA
jgi:hypothetical protein